MNVLPDANIIINLKAVDKLNLLLEICDSFGWDIVLSEKVFDELTTINTRDQFNNQKIKTHKPLDSVLQKRLDSGQIKKKSGNASHVQSIRTIHAIGYGESDIISIIESCNENKRENYLMLTEDKKPSGIASELNILNENLCCFLIRGIQNKIIDRGVYLNLIDQMFAKGILDNKRYHYCKEILRN